MLPHLQDFQFNRQFLFIFLAIWMAISPLSALFAFSVILFIKLHPIFYYFTLDILSRTRQHQQINIFEVSWTSLKHRFFFWSLLSSFETRLFQFSKYPLKADPSKSQPPCFCLFPLFPIYFLAKTLNEFFFDKFLNVRFRLLNRKALALYLPLSLYHWWNLMPSSAFKWHFAVFPPPILMPLFIAKIEISKWEKMCDISVSVFVFEWVISTGLGTQQNKGLLGKNGQNTELNTYFY